MAGRAQADLYPDDNQSLCHCVVENPTPERRHLIKVPHEQTKRTTITVSQCEIVSSRDGGYQFLLRRGARLISLDIAQMIRSFQQFLQSLFRWIISDTHVSIIPKPLMDVPVGPLPPIVDAPRVLSGPQASSASSSDAMQLVPTLNPDESYTLGRLHYLGAMNGEVPSNRLEAVHANTVAALVRHGVVSQREDEFGMLQLAVRQERLMHVPIYIIRDHIPAHRFLHTSDPLKNRSSTTFSA